MRFVGLVAVVGGCLVLGAPAEGRACGNSTRHAMHHVTAIKELVEQGRHKQAVAALREVFKDDMLALKGLPGDEQRLLARGHSTLAVIVARSRGAVELEPGIGGKQPAKRAAAIEWAINSMRWHLSGNIDSFELVCSPGKCRGIDDPERSAILAELLALRADGRAEALGILRGLAKDDLMPSAQGWAVLAALQRQGGEAEAATLSASRCEQIAGTPAACSFIL
jgi:hypothetical protein